MNAYSNAKDYKGIYPPRCNNGDPCDECLRIYKENKMKYNFVSKEKEKNNE